jgi:hypothetical protein
MFWILGMSGSRNPGSATTCQNRTFPTRPQATVLFYIFRFALSIMDRVHGMESKSENDCVLWSYTGTTIIAVYVRNPDTTPRLDCLTSAMVRSERNRNARSHVTLQILIFLNRKELSLITPLATSSQNVPLAVSIPHSNPQTDYLRRRPRQHPRPGILEPAAWP